MTTDLPVNELHPLIYSTARKVQSVYPYKSVYEYADEAWRWAHAHPQRIENALAEEYDWKRLERALERTLERHGRILKAAASGYRVEDEAHYPTSLIELALPAVWDITVAADAPVQDEDVDDGKKHLPPKRVSDPAEGNNWLATCVDVRAAFFAADLSHELSYALFERYSLGRTSGEYEDHLVQGALRKIQRRLGGERPAGCSPSCECGGLF